MKSRKLFRAVLATFAIAAIFSSCSFLDKDDDSTAITESSQKGRLLFSVDSSARAVSTINPTGFDFASDSGLTFTLNGTLNGTRETLGTWSDSSDTKAYALMSADSSILVDTGIWTFRLSVATSSGEVLYGLLEKSIVADNNTLDFGTLSEASSTDTTRDSTVSVAKGSVNVSLSFPADSTALGATATLTAIGATAGDAVPLEIATSDTTSSVTYTATDVNAGNYILAIKLYSNAGTKDSTTYLNTYTAVVKVVPGQTSTGSAELTDLNKLCTITYELNGGSFSDTVQTSYNKYKKFTLPTPEQSYYDFNGWSTTSQNTNTADYADGDSIFLSEDTTLYALWILNSTKFSEYISSLTEDTTVYIKGTLTEELFAEIAAAIKSGSYKVTLNLSGTTGLTAISDASSYSDGIFYNNTNLAGIILPDSLTYIGSYTFGSCTSLTSVTIPNSVTSIKSNAFWNCKGLTGVYITDIAAWCNISFSVSESNPLLYAKNLYLNDVLVTDLTIPNSVTSIGNDAFYNCDSLTNLTIPNSVTSIESYAFTGCDSLTSVVIPDSVTSIGTFAFDNCDSLTGVYITDIAAWCNISFGYSEANPLYYAGNLYLNNELVTDLTIPDSVTSIGGYAFTGCTSLTNVTIPDSVTSIGNHAFYGCTSLTNVTIPDSVTSIGVYVFYNCTSLTSITIPNSVTSIGSYAFEKCTGLTGVYITDLAAWCNISFSVSESNPLYYARKLYLNNELVTDLKIPDSVTSIGKYAFYGCTSLISITVPDSVTSIGDAAFGGCSSLTNMTIPFVGRSASATSASSSTLFGYIFGTTSYTGGSRETQYYSKSSRITYYIPSSLKKITVTGGNILYGAFYSCDVLTSITIPDSVTSIGDYAFDGCDKLMSIIIGSNVEKIGYHAFYDCSKLTSATFKDTTTWYFTSNSSYTGGKEITTSNALSSTSTAASYLSSIYYNYYWYKE